MLWKIMKTEIFEKKFRKLDKDIQRQIEKIKGQLKKNPYIGKQLQVEFLREKKIGKFRIYYLIYDEYIIVYMITIGDKKDQQKTINTIQLFLDKYREDIENWMQEHNF